VFATLTSLLALSWLAPLWAGVSATIVLGIVFLNRALYIFYARERGSLFAAAVIPMHVLYFLYSGLAFGCGLLLHLLHDRRAHAT